MKTKKIVLLGFALCVALILSYIETLIPFGFGIPGIKLGLANLIVLIILYMDMPIEAIMVSMARIILMGLLFGSLSSMIYAFFGGMLSFLCMYLFRRFNRFSPIGVSCLGGIMHNVGQLIVASLVVRTNIFAFYFPYLLLAGLLTGLLIGVIGNTVISRYSKYLVKWREA